MMLHVAHFEFVTCLKCERIELSDSTRFDDLNPTIPYDHSLRANEACQSD